MTVSGLLFPLFFVAGAVFAASVGWRWRQARRLTAEAWRARRDAQDPEIQGLDEARFRRIFLRHAGPRGGLYALGAGLAAMGSTPILFFAIERLWALGWIAAGRPPLFAQGELVTLFLQFFALIACWAAIAYAFAWRFHTDRPRSLEIELQSARADAEIERARKS